MGRPHNASYVLEHIRCGKSASPVRRGESESHYCVALSPTLLASLAFSRTGNSSDDPVQNRSCSHLEPFGDLGQCAKFHVHLSTLDLTHVRAMDMASVCKVLLGPATCRAYFPEAITECLRKS